jgi:hypothetical protein
MKRITPEQYNHAPREQMQGGAKHEGGHHVIRYRILNDTAYQEETPFDLLQALERLRESQATARVFLGDPKTGLDWNEECDVVGRIGRSSGRIKIPLLVPPGDDRGPGLLDHCIVRLVKVRGRKELYRHPGYRCRDLRIQDEPCQGRPDLKATVYRDSQEIARFQSRNEAAHWVQFMRGEVTTAFNPKTQSAKRAQRARELLARLDLPQEESLVEMLADLRHYCYRHKLDFAQAAEAATQQFKLELQGIYP